jgi:hypothetical protein
MIGVPTGGVALCATYASATHTGTRLFALVLNLILAKGFDPNRTIIDMSNLHMALRNGHKECTLALVST